MMESVMLRRVILGLSVGLFTLFCVQGGSGCTSGQDNKGPSSLPAIQLVEAFPKLSFDLPVFLCGDGADDSLLYVVEQEGKIWRFKNDKKTGEKDLFFDISSRIPGRRHNEEGLLALAFHPKFKENGYFYVCYSQHDPRRGLVSRFTWDKRKDEVADTSETVILNISQPYGNHNGCTLVFGPDGYLYASFGDGGSAGDPKGSGQDKSSLLGAILRIDVDATDLGKKYAIPEDNPFKDDKDAAPEIWAWGLRNVWRMSFDRKDGTLWAGDVGQNAYEEVDIIVKGGNYGWNKREGTHDYRGGDKAKDMIDPVAEYGRNKGISITGGYVYRGEAQKSLQGIYLYADYGTGRVWGLKWDAEKEKVDTLEEIGHFPRATISSFGEDAKGELYVCGHRVGAIYRIEVKADNEEED
ncbi:MAG: PQQ-dependent sugar dehydrogenase, partial [Planctomycetes bacterium]|nr:PQQ-dependent sugar dehydrogenase [Planctomycetota bacterium]